MCDKYKKDFPEKFPAELGTYVIKHDMTPSRFYKQVANIAGTTDAAIRYYFKNGISPRGKVLHSLSVVLDMEPGKITDMFASRADHNAGSSNASPKDTVTTVSPPVSRDVCRGIIKCLFIGGRWHALVDKDIWLLSRPGESIPDFFTRVERSPFITRKNTLASRQKKRPRHDRTYKGGWSR